MDKYSIYQILNPSNILNMRQPIGSLSSLIFNVCAIARMGTGVSSHRSSYSSYAPVVDEQNDGGMYE